MNKLVLVFAVIAVLSSMSPTDSYARNVTCRVMDKDGKIAGTYVHSEPDFPVCSCTNQDIPGKFKSICDKSLKAF